MDGRMGGLMNWFMNKSIFSVKNTAWMVLVALWCEDVSLQQVRKVYTGKEENVISKCNRIHSAAELRLEQSLTSIQRTTHEFKDRNVLTQADRAWASWPTWNHNVQVAHRTWPSQSSEDDQEVSIIYVSYNMSWTCIQLRSRLAFPAFRSQDYI